MEGITYRNATIQDARFIALVVAEAVGNTLMERLENNTYTQADKDILSQITSVCSRTDTLYSWKNAQVAVSPTGECIGALISYAGEGYLQQRETTFQLLSRLIHFDVEQMDEETKDGEYYLDSLAVLPQWRGRGVARQLLIEGLKKAQTMRCPAILACAPENIGAKHLYESLGFEEQGHMFIFGEDYLRMVSSSSFTSS